MASSEQQSGEPWFLKTSYPVLVPAHEALTLSNAEFDNFIAEELGRPVDTVLLEKSEPELVQAMSDVTSDTETFTLVSESSSTEIRDALAAARITEDVEMKDESNLETKTSEADAPAAGPFMKALLEPSLTPTPPNMDNKILTENDDLAHRSTNSPLVDLFFELEEVLSGPRLRELLDGAWAADPLATLKIIFNARSIHLGKSSKNIFYRAAGWLAQNHPFTLVANLRWLSRPVIEKKAKKEGEDDLVIVESELDEEDLRRYDVQYGVSHGYWKDLLNLLVLAVNKKLDVLSNPRDVLNVENGIIKHKAMQRRYEKSEPRGAMRGGRGRGAMARQRVTRRSKIREKPMPHALEEKTVHIGNHQTAKKLALNRHKDVVAFKFYNDKLYRVLHLAIARLFAEQLQSDLTALHGTDAKAKKAISLCGKWAPSHGHSHDRQTTIISSIAEIMYPRESFDDTLSPSDTRETYLRHARERYRKDVSALRKHMDVVERDISAKTFSNIHYDRVPSQALQNYTRLFITKDFERFESYIDRLAEGKAKISGATLFLSVLVRKARMSNALTLNRNHMMLMSPNDIVERKMKEMEAKVADGQWSSLVQRIKDSGTLSSSIAVCDVSGSMSHPTFSDGTCPMDSAIGLSLLVAEVTEPPFGGAFITFSATPEVVQVKVEESFTSKVSKFIEYGWGYNTDFVATFEKLILPMAVKNKVKQEDMVKRVFVFSDMQFDEAEITGNQDKWSTSYERIEKKFKEAGYDMPELIFWNLAGGRAGYGGQSDGDPVAPKPVLASQTGTSLVSGYSQALMKAFMDNGSFEDPEDEEDESEEEAEEEPTKETEDDDAVVVMKDDSVKPEKKNKDKKNPLVTLKRVIGHKAYNMLRVVD